MAYPDYKPPSTVTQKNADEIIKQATAALGQAIEAEEEQKKKNKQKTQMQLVKEAYDKKITWYIDEIVKLDSDRDRMIEKIKKNQYQNIQYFISIAEKNGINRMNHETIISMLQKQYQEWFGQLPEHLSIPEYKICFDELEVL